MADPVSLGGVNQEEVAAEATEMGVPGEAGSLLITRFTRRVANLVATRQAKGEVGQFAVFLQSENVTEHAKRCAHEEEPLLANGADPVSNSVWLSSSNLDLSFRLCLKWSDAGSLFAAIREVGLGELPALVVDFRGDAPIGRLYSLGLTNAATCDHVSFDDMPITEAQMKEALDHFYSASLRTPLLVVEAHAQRVWKDASKGIPENRPEEKIQGRVIESLRGAFPRHDLRGEPVTEDGRADIVISKKTVTSGNLRAVIHEWVLELKALADMTTNGTKCTTNISDAIRSGLEQAIAYRFRLNALNAALCCYDMREADEGDAACFAHIAMDAASGKVPLWRWYMFRTAAASRAAQGFVRAG
jgi:hypothetical protein